MMMAVFTGNRLFRSLEITINFVFFSHLSFQLCLFVFITFLFNLFSIFVVVLLIPLVIYLFRQHSTKVQKCT